MKIFVYMLEKDDPKKCTAAKLVRFNLAERVRYIPYKSILLDPYAKDVLSKEDKPIITAIDCSWKDTRIFKQRLPLMRRRLPLLFAGNPINYAKPHLLSTAEALASASIILGYKEVGLNIMSKFKWGNTFLDLNKALFDDYTKAKSRDDILKIEQEYINIITGSH